MKSSKTQHLMESPNTSSGITGVSEKNFFSAVPGVSTPFFKPASVQPKLNISQPGDKFEQQTDRIADAIVQRKCTECAKEESLQKKEYDSATSESTTGEQFSGHLQSSRGSGSPLPKIIQTEMSQKMGMDFTNVNIHTSKDAIQMSRSLGTRAFTHGNDIYFNSGEYNPSTNEGKHLLAHELVHAIQQTGMSIQKQDKSEEAGNGQQVQNTKLELGRKLLDNFPYGVNVAFYERTNDEARRRAKDWAKFEDAIATSASALTVKNLAFGIAFSDKFDIESTLKDLHTILSECVKLARKDAHTPTGAKPMGIKTLALFAHGTSNWCGISDKDINLKKASKLLKGIASTLTKDVNVILYACNVARGTDEKQNWVKGTLEGGGSSSLSGKIRDELLQQGLEDATVWGHTTTGHVTTNFALRYFEASAGKETEGTAFAGEFVFGVVGRAFALADLRKKINEQGYLIPEDIREKFNKEAYKKIDLKMYHCYTEANKKLNFEGRNLAEAAPTNPFKVAEIILKHWESEYWPNVQSQITDELISDFKLKKEQTKD